MRDSRDIGTYAGRGKLKIGSIMTGAMMGKCGLLLAAAAVALVGCGGGGDGGADANASASCGFTGDGYLPYDVGYHWEYKVTDLSTLEVTTKTQSVTETVTAGDGMPAYVQLTEKQLVGSTENWIRVDGTQNYRIQQRDFDSAGTLERTTVYAPKKIRLDWGDWLSAGSMTESYSATITNAMGEQPPLAIEEAWTVIGTDVACSSDFGSFRCLHIRRARTLGGVSDKEFWFAPGIGKVREEGGQIEELIGCGVD